MVYSSQNEYVALVDVFVSISKVKLGGKRNSSIVVFLCGTKADMPNDSRAAILSECQQPWTMTGRKGDDGKDNVDIGNGHYMAYNARSHRDHRTNHHEQIAAYN